MKVQKLKPEAILPVRMTDGAAGYDFTAMEDPTLVMSVSGPYYEYNTNIAVEIPEGYVGLVVPRSSITSKTTFTLGNSCGIIDSDYRGSIKFQFRTLPGFPVKMFKAGDRIGQLVLVQNATPEIKEVTELSKTKRGDGGFGSTNA